MIEAKDLRIGNFFSIDGEEYKVGAISRTGTVSVIEPFFQPKKFDLDKIKPLALSSVWLELLGFQEHGIGEYYYFHPHYSVRDKSVKIYQLQNGFQLEYKIEGIDVWQVITIQYVHQLQNIYYALTGEELEYNL